MSSGILIFFFLGLSFVRGNSHNCTVSRMSCQWYENFDLCLKVEFGNGDFERIVMRSKKDCCAFKGHFEFDNSNSVVASSTNCPITVFSDIAVNITLPSIIDKMIQSPLAEHI